MFVGHFALAFAAKRATPRIPLPVLFVAAQLADTLWPIFVAIGLEQVRIDPGNTAVTPLDFVSYPYSHSLLTLAIFGVAFGALYRRSSREFLAIAALVVSHWGLDYVTHRPDMPVYPGGGPKLGLGLWNSVPWTIAIELALFAAGAAVYGRLATVARDRIGTWSFTTLMMFLAVVYAANIAGPPPPSVTAIWASAIPGMVILLAWSGWVERHRTAILPTP